MKSVGKKLKHSSRKKVILIGAIALLVIAVSASAYAYYAKIGPFAPSQPTTQGVNYKRATDAQTSATGSTKNSSGTTETTGSDSSPSPTPSTGSGQKPTVNMTITYTKVENGTFYVGTLIATISSTGSCTLTLTAPNGTKYNTTSGAQAGPSTSTCQNLAVPISAPTTGKWHVVVSYSDESVQANATQDATIQ